MGAGRHLILGMLVLAALAAVAAATADARIPRFADGVETYAVPGWPVAPVDEQHPIRGSFFDPRPSASGLVYHNGIDISVREDQLEEGRPPYRAHRVYALEGGEVQLPDDVTRRRCAGRSLRVGRFGYGHVDAVGTVEDGQHVEPGQPIGWTCKGQWHMHLSEFKWVDGRQVWVNPLRPGGRLRPYTDTLAPVVHEIGFFEPAQPSWAVVDGAVTSPATGARYDAAALRGTVDVRARIGDPQSFAGWMGYFSFSFLRSEHVPSEIEASARAAGGPVLWRRTVFRADVLPAAFPYGEPYAPGTSQNLPVASCFHASQERCAGQYWFHVGAGPSSSFWNTESVPNGAYELCVSARDAVGNVGSSCVRATVAN